MFQSPYGGKGRSDNLFALGCHSRSDMFQSPCGGRGRSDHAAKANTKTEKAKVSITLRWQG